MADDYTPLEQWLYDTGIAMPGEVRSMAKSIEHSEWLAAHDAEKRAEWEAEQGKPAPCVMTHTPPFDFAQCETHDETFPLGSVCKWHGKESVAQVLQDEADAQRVRAVRAEHELEMLRAEQGDPAKDERLARYMAMVTPLGYQSALTAVQAMTKLLAAEDIARSQAEQGETEWEYGYELIESDTRDVLTRGEPVVSEGHARRAAKIAHEEESDPGFPSLDVLIVRRRKAGLWLPVPDTASESREERSPADDPAPHWAVISAGNIVIAQGYCWCNDPNGGYHQIGIKPAPVPDTTKAMIRCDYCGDDLPSVRSRADVPTTPNLQRVGFDADKVVCTECAGKALHPTNTESEDE